MYSRQLSILLVLSLCILTLSLCFTALNIAQDATDDKQIIERYKLMLRNKPKEGSTFDRLYQLYLEGAGLDALLADFQSEAEEKPDDTNIHLILGHIYKRIGKETDAVNSYERAVELEPNSYYPHFALGQTYTLLLQHENAINALKQAATLAKNIQDATPDEFTTIYKSLGRAYFRRDQIDEAITAWTKIAELNPNDVFARTELADLFIEQELYQQAITQHEAIIKLRKDDPYQICLSQREIGNIYETQGDNQQAIQSYDTALALTASGNWLRKDLQHRIIGIFAADSDWQGLIRYYQQKLEKTPNEPELLGLLAAAYIENQQLDEGIKGYRKGLELAPTDTTLRLNLIAALRNDDKFAEAASEYENLLEQDPDDFGIYRELGELYIQLEDEKQARSIYKQMLDRDPNNASTHLILAEIYTGNEWIEDATTAYQKAISLAPNNLDYIEYFGEFYLRQGSRDKAIETWNWMVVDSKGIAENYNRLAKLLSSKNFHTEAIEASQKAVELMPDVYEYRKILAQRLMKHGDFDEAQIQFSEATKIAPNPFFAEEMDDQRIELYRRQGKLVEKIETLETELDNSAQSNADTFAQQKRLAKMYLKLGNITYALEVILKARDLKPDDVIVNRWLADVYIKQNRFDDANAVYMHLIQVDSANAREYWTNITRSHLNVMDSDAATKAAKQVIANSPRNPEGHQLLAEIAKQTTNYDRAIESLKQAIRLRSDAINIRTELAETYKLADKPRQALAQYWRCWELCNTVNDKISFVKPLSETYYDLGRSSEFKEKLKQLSKSNVSDTAPVLALAELHRMEGDLPSARFQLARALDKQRNDPDLLSQLVSISLNLGDNQDALSYQERLVKAHPDPTHQRRLGELLFDAGREQEAIQAWTKLLHAKNQSLEAEVKLASLLIKHGHLHEANLVLDRAAEKITGKDAHLALFQLGTVLVSMNEFERAQSHFKRIINMPKPPESGISTNTKKTFSSIYYDKFDLAQYHLYDIQDQSYRAGNVQAWKPSNFDEAQAGALVHLMTISQYQGKLNQFIQQYEKQIENNPKDINTLELLAQIYTLTDNTEKTDEIIEQLTTVSPNDSTYQAIRYNRALRNNSSIETLEKYISKFSEMDEEKRLLYNLQYINRLYRDGKKTEAEKLISKYEDIKVMDIDVVAALIKTLALMMKTDTAESILDRVPIPTQSQQSKYRYLYYDITNTYLSLEQYDKAIDLFWIYCTRTQPQLTNIRRMVSLTTISSSSSSSSIQAIFPTRTVYYQGSRLGYLKTFSRQLWFKNQQEALYTKLQTTFDASDGRDRIFSGLALSYCYWWNGEREKAQEILVALQKEFPKDLSLKLNTVFISIQTGQNAGTLRLLEELSNTDPSNRSYYYNLILKLAIKSGNTVVVRDLITDLLKTPSSARELYTVSEQLQNAGYTQHASAIMNKAMNLAMGVQDPNFLMDVSELLEDLGRGQDAIRIAERALRFANKRDRYGRTISTWNRQQATHLTSQTNSRQEREMLLIEAARKNPNSYKAQLNLADFYHGKDHIDKASAAFKKVLELRPTDTTTRKRYADLLFHSGRYNEAVPEYTRLLKDNPTSLGYDTWDTIECFFKAEKVDELISIAIDMISPSIGRDYNNELARDVASELRDINRYTEAIEIYEKLIQAQPTDTYYHRNKAETYAQLNEYDKAIHILRDTLDIDDEYSQIITIDMLVRYYKSLGKLNELIKEYEVKLAEKPNDNNLRFFLTIMKIAENDLKGADELTTHMLNAEHINSNYLNRIAEANRLTDAREREQEILEKIIQSQKGYWYTYRRLGMIYALKGETEKAQDAYRKMARHRIRSGNSMDYMNVASIFIQEQMWDEAEPILTEIINDQSVQSHHRREAEEKLVAIKKRRDDLSNTTQLKDRIVDMDIGSLRTLARDYVRRKERQNALLIYTHLEEVIPEDFESRAQLATLYTVHNQHEKAVKTWEALLAEDPKNTKFQDGLVNTYQTAGKIEKALETTQQFIKEDVDNPINYERKARLYANEDEIDKAIACYQKAIELAPGNVKRYKELASLYIRNDDKDAAKMAFQEALRFTGQEYERQRIQREILKLSGSKEKIEETVQKAADAGTITFEMQKEHANTYKDDGKLSKASTAYVKALEMTSDSSERTRIYEQLLEIYPKLGNDEAAIKTHDELAFSVSIVNSAQLARDRLIRAYDNIKKLDVLISIFKTRLENDPDSIVNLELLAAIYNRAKEFGKAAETYNALSILQPNGVLYYYNAAAAYNRNGQSELAKELLRQGESALFVSNNDSIYFLRELGNICYDGKLYDSAIKLADAAIAESANSRMYGFGVAGETAYKLLAKSYYAAKRYEEAVYTYQQVLNMSENSWDRDEARKKIESASRLGNLYEKQIPKLLKKVQEYPDDPEARLNLAETYEKANKFNDAITHYETLSQLQPDNIQWHKKIGTLYLTIPPEKLETGEVRKSNALELKGNGSFVEVPPSDSLNSITDQVTVSAWIYPTSFPSNYVRIVFKSDEKRQNFRQRSYILVIRQDGKLKINGSPKGGGYASLYSEPNLIKLNTWTHIAGVINAKQDNMKVFVNGFEVGNRHFNGQDSLMKTRLPLRIGATHVTTEVDSSSFIGQIDEVRIWNIARTQQEILTDMNHELNGNEKGLVAYWKFDGENNGITLDSTDNNNHGTLIDNASISPYARNVFENTKKGHLTKAAAAYEKTIELDPTSYDLYQSLAESYTKLGKNSEVENVYLRALDAPLTQSNHNDAIQAIWDIYANTQNQDNGIAKLKELQQKIKNSATLFEILGDAYSKAGETEKAKNAYTQWVELRQRQVNQQGSASNYNNFAIEILNKGILPEEAIKNAKLAAQLDNSSENVLTLGYVYLVIGQKDDALEALKKGFKTLSTGTFQRKFFGWISDYGNNTDNKESYVELLNELVNTETKNVVVQLNLRLLIAEYCLKNDMHETARENIQKTGFITEDKWMYLGPFDNSNDNAFDTQFISEEITKIDLISKYDGKNGNISWKKLKDDNLNAFINLGEGLDLCAGYAFTTITSPDDREVQFRFDSDDQGKIWLNGIVAGVNMRTYATSIDRLNYPVKLKKGKNSVLVKVCEKTGGWGFYLRVTDQDGNPFDDLVFSPTEN